MKVLLATYSAATHTSFGRITRDLWKRLVQTGRFKVVQQGWFHRKTVLDGDVPWEIVPTNAGFDENGNPMLSDADRYGAKSLARMIQMTKPDIVWSLADAYMIPHLIELKRRFRFKLALWVPVDGEPYPAPFGEFLKHADRLYGITGWGAERLSHVTGKKCGFIYHGVDTEVFKPVASEHREQVRRVALGNKYNANVKLIGFVGHNQFRKMPWIVYPIQYYLRSGNWAYSDDGLVLLGTYDRTKRQGRGPEPIQAPGRNWHMAKQLDARFWVHSFEQAEGINFRYEEEVWGQQGEVVYTGNLSPVRGFSDPEMNDLYNMFDIYASFSGGEGFGMPLIEAAAVGLPVFYTDYSGQAEIGAKVHGMPVKVGARIVEHGSGIERAIADISDAVHKLYRMCETGSNVSLYRNAAKSNFDYDVIAAQWAQELEDLHADTTTEAFGVKL